MITAGIIALTAIISLAALGNRDLFDKLCLRPYAMNQDKSGWFRFISCGFVHAGPGHLLFNMITLWFFGRVLENDIFKELQFTLFYFSALLCSALPEYQKQKDNPQYKACGASGAVSAILFALVLYQPWGMVYIKLFIPVYFVLFAAGYLVYSWYKSRRQEDNIAHGVHLWGALYGIAFTLLTHPSALRIFLDKVQHPPFLS